MLRSIALTILLAGLACQCLAEDAAVAPPPPDIFWPMFAANPARDGNSRVSFPANTLGLLWSSPKPDVVYKYRKGQTGSSPIIVSVGGKNLVIVGSYDRNVYAFDAFTGQEQWRFTTGDAVTATPCYAEVAGEPMVFAASSDRTVYALNPITGKQRDSKGRQMWTWQAYPWSETVAPAVIGDPLAAEIDGRKMLLLTIWINDRKSEGNVQRSDVCAFDASSGQLLWKAEVGSGTASAPALGKVKDEPAVFVAHDAGAVHAFSARDGRALWPKPFIGQYDIRSGVSYAEVEGKRLLFFGSRLWSVFCISADTGDLVWELRVGAWVDSTPAIYFGGPRPAVIFGDYQQVLRGVDAAAGKELWNYRSYGYFCGSPTLIELGGAPAAAIPCLDNHLYVVNVNDGSFLFRAYTGEFLWSHYQRGDTVWPSAAAGRLAGRPVLAVASYDGRVHVFGISEGAPPVGRPDPRFDANVGEPTTSLIDTLGGRIFGYVFGAIVLAALAYSGMLIARRMKRESRRTV